MCTSLRTAMIWQRIPPPEKHRISLCKINSKAEKTCQRQNWSLSKTMYTKPVILLLGKAKDKVQGNQESYSSKRASKQTTSEMPPILYIWLSFSALNVLWRQWRRTRVSWKRIYPVSSIGSGSGRRHSSRVLLSFTSFNSLGLESAESPRTTLMEAAWPGDNPKSACSQRAVCCSWLREMPHFFDQDLVATFSFC